ncbi:pyruvate formate-lyase-activating protein [Propionispira arboris]|nr:pyruvate formate-lyase-activating protein [Propionispira arboris]
MMIGYYHSKETFGTVDGEGIRYVLFLAGCGLGCAFCHNPDTWIKGERSITVEATLKDINQYRNFYDASGGGFTASGGEPLLQPNFVTDLFAACQKDGIHTTLDTAGFCKTEALLQVLPYTDHVLFSLKAIDHKLHRKLTLADSNEAIIRNLRYIAEHKPVTVRYVVIPQVTDDAESIKKLIELLHSIKNVQLKVDVLPYHFMGAYKWNELGMVYKLEGVPAATSTDVKRVSDMLLTANIPLQYPK